MAFSSFALFFISLTTSSIQLSYAAGCDCKSPAMVGSMVVVPGKIACDKVSSVDRSFFTNLEANAACSKSFGTAIGFSLANVDKPFSLSNSAFDSPSSKLTLEKFFLRDSCLQELNLDFFGVFINSAKLSTVAFTNMRCLQVMAASTFSNLEVLNTIRWTGARVGIETIEEDTFRKLPALEELAITKTKLRNLPSVLLRGPTSLREINLKDNQIETIPSTFFDLDTQKKVKVDLSNNKIKTLPAGLFAKLNLVSLNLNGNMLVSFELSILGTGNLKGIQQLALSNNRLTKLDGTYFQNRTEDSFSISAGNNPWHCVCSIYWLRGVYVEDEPDIRCASPDRFKDRSLSESLYCPNGNSMKTTDGGTYTFVTKTPDKDGAKLKGASVGGGGPSKMELIAIGTSVAVIAIALIVILIVYRCRGRMCQSKKKQKTAYQAANTEEGYDGEPPMRTYVV